MTGKKTKQTRRKYDATFKEEVLKMVASGRSVSEISQALGIGENLIYRRKSSLKPLPTNYHKINPKAVLVSKTSLIANQKN